MASTFKVQNAMSINPTCDIVEYANIRFTLSCLNASKLPIVIVAAANHANITGQSTSKINVSDKNDPVSVNKTKNVRKNNAKPAAFGATDKKAVIVIGDPSYTSGVQ